MCKKLPIGGFKLANIEEYTEEKIKSYNDDRSFGALLKVDIEDPRDFHILHKDLPLLCDRKKLNKTSRLITSKKKNRKEYVVHISSLKQALNHGLKFKKVHVVIEFKTKSMDEAIY